jgi:hypothetical protein
MTSGYELGIERAIARVRANIDDERHTQHQRGWR